MARAHLQFEISNPPCLAFVRPVMPSEFRGGGSIGGDGFDGGDEEGVVGGVGVVDGESGLTVQRWMSMELASSGLRCGSAEGSLVVELLSWLSAYASGTTSCFLRSHVVAFLADRPVVGMTDSSFLLAPRRFIDTARVRENWSLVPLVMARCCETGTGM